MSGAGRRLSPNAVRMAAALRVGQVLHRVQGGPQQLVQAGEGQVRLRLDAGRGEHPVAPAARGVDRSGQQRGLADPGLAPHEQGSARGREAVEELQEASDLGRAPVQRDPRHA